MPRSRQLSAPLALFCAVLLLAAVSCSDDEGADRPQPTTTTVSTTTTTSPEQADEEALRALAEDWYEASDRIYQHRAEPESAAEYLIDPYLADYVARANQVVDAGQISEPSERSSLEVRDVTINGDTATVVECAVDADILRDADGRVVNEEVLTLLLETDAQRTAEGWRFSDRRTLEELAGAKECPAS